ncbi:bacterio-opsin activator domain-containing protein [Natrinema altunense]|uniref:Bacterio-opsin activator n=1 Tax=Natrinema altunense (strain JCM 12890 / CGMCC 1.3731 / AJ2) TaxID=1227494 RepID=L9ZYN2_NATA2|nr:bacterio-opsin activator domain-containing protein [Natrinema altunense]ELY90707.1 bacterio-opsin activator [Natrinema altunense JCM 12890]
MDDVDTERGGPVDDAAAAARALEHVVDPVVAVTEGTITYANEAARDAFELGDADREAATALGTRWTHLATAINETTVGTARHVDLADHRESVRIHRGTSGATLTFEREGTGTDATAESTADSRSGASDRLVKDRALEEAPVGITISDPDREDNPLVYVNEAYEEMTGYEFDEVVGRNCRFLQGEDSDEAAIAEMAAAIDEDRPVTVELKNYRKDGTEFWNEVTIAPVRDEDGRVTNYVGFQNDITARKEAELALERQTEELQYILDRVQGLIQDVTAVVAGSTDRSELEREVCARIAAEDAYDGVWIGERNPATGTVEVRSSVGDGPDGGTVATDTGHPAAEALATTEPAVDTVDGLTRAAFPLSYNGIEYGVVTIRTERPIDDRETVILSALARAVASGVNARETSRVLATDAVVAVELEVTDRALAPVALSAADCRLEYSRSVHRTDDETASLFTVTGASADEITAAADDLADADCRIVVERDEECLVELTGGEDLVGWLSERGVRTKAIEAEAGRARVTLEIPRSANVRSVVEAVEDRYDGTDVRSFQQREPDGETRQEFAARLEEALTDRQFGALQRAYLGGYFEWPRPTTGEELAQSMGVSRPTFHEHLRTAEAKLCRAFFGDA